MINQNKDQQCFKRESNSQLIKNKMSKDPAFLFYSRDFYEGTRMMLPEERACYLDLLIYQHQHGYIPDDLKRVLLYCSGVDEATLKATLKAKFKLCDKGWYNHKLSIVIAEREEFTKKQSINGAVGQFWKKAKAILPKQKYNELRNSLSHLSNNELFEKIKEIEINEATLIAMLEAMLKHLANANAIANEDEVKEEKKVSFAEFVTMTNDEHSSLVEKYGKDKTSEMVDKLNNYKGSSGKKYKSDYRAILSWVADQVMKNTSNGTKKTEHSTIHFEHQNYGDSTI